MIMAIEALQEMWWKANTVQVIKVKTVKVASQWLRDFMTAFESKEINVRLIDIRQLLQ